MTIMAVISEAGVNIPPQRSKHVDELSDVQFDCVVTVCDSAAESCRVFRGEVKVVHDPPWLAREAASEEETMGPYRRVRDEIRDDVVALPEALNGVKHGK